jgi:hypothetical protein
MIDLRRFFRKLGIALNLRDPPNVPPHGWSYFDHLVAVYVTLNTADPRASAVIAKSRNNPDDLTWGDIFLLESTIFSLQPPEIVERSAWILRERFREITSSSVYEKYIGSNIPTESDTPAKLSLLKADLTRVLDVLHWYYSLIPMREKIRKSLTAKCILMVAVYTVLLGLTLVWCYLGMANFLAMLACVLYFGIIGGFVSSQRRMQSISSDADPLISVFGLDTAGYYLWLSPLLGAIFAVILALMFIAGVLKGAVFPEFYVASAGATKGLPLFHFTWNTLPKTSEEYAKLLVWAFLAGFAERLVPDSLDRLASKLERADRAAPLPPGPPPNAARGKNGPAPEPPPPPAETKPKIAPETLQNIMHTGEGPRESEGTVKGPHRDV